MAKGSGLTNPPNVNAEVNLCGELTIGIDNCWVYGFTNSGPMKITGEGETEEGYYNLNFTADMQESHWTSYKAPKK